jgi:hypothetical protein
MLWESASPSPSPDELRSISNTERYLRIAKAEQASSPCGERLRAFMELVEGLLREEMERLIAR